jgi:hypothetical protein
MHILKWTWDLNLPYALASNLLNDLKTKLIMKGGYIFTQGLI